MKYDFKKELEAIEAALAKQLPDTATEAWMETSFGNIPIGTRPLHTVPLLAPTTKLIHNGGKRWRPLLLVFCAQLVSKTDTIPAVAYELTPLLEFIHTASLIHDDIEDSANTRRGAPAAHIAYGLDTALNAGAWLYFQAPVCITTSDLPGDLQLQLYQLYGTELRRLHLGQAMDISWHRENTKIPSVEEYMAMVRLKTGTLASLAAQTGAIVGGAPAKEVKTLGDIANDIGIGFQILDDYINLSTGNVGKKRGDDIVEGKKSLPVLLHLSKKPEDFQIIMDYFKRARIQGVESPVVEECIALLESSGALTEAAEQAKQLIIGSCNTIRELYPNSDSSAKIASLFDNMLTKAVK